MTIYLLLSAPTNTVIDYKTVHGFCLCFIDLLECVGNKLCARLSLNFDANL